VIDDVYVDVILQLCISINTNVKIWASW